MVTKLHEAVVIGGSAGSFKVLCRLLNTLPIEFPIPIVVVQHVWKYTDGLVAETLNQISSLHVMEAEEKISPRKAHVYLAPGGYHLLFERDKTFSLSIDPPVNYSRPSIDVLFYSAAEAFGESLIAVLLTGANADGAKGLKAIKDAGGVVIVQDPETAESSYMPQMALKMSPAAHTASIEQIGELLLRLTATQETPDEP